MSSRSRWEEKHFATTNLLVVKNGMFYINYSNSTTKCPKEFAALFLFLDWLNRTKNHAVHGFFEVPSRSFAQKLPGMRLLHTRSGKHIPKLIPNPIGPEKTRIGVTWLSHLAKHLK